MMQVQLQPNDPDAAPIIQEALSFFRTGLESYDFTENQLIDIMRMVNAAVSGFIAVEQAGLLTLNRSSAASFGVMLDALFVAIEHIRAS